MILIFSICPICYFEQKNHFFVDKILQTKYGNLLLLISVYEVIQEAQSTFFSVCIDITPPKNLISAVKISPKLKIAILLFIQLVPTCWWCSNIILSSFQAWESSGINLNSGFLCPILLIFRLLKTFFVHFYAFSGCFPKDSFSCLSFVTSWRKGRTQEMVENNKGFNLLNLGECCLHPWLNVCK